MKIEAGEGKGRRRQREMTAQKENREGQFEKRGRCNKRRLSKQEKK